MSQRHGQRRHPQILAPADGSIASANKRKGSPCQQDDDSFSKEDGDSQACETVICPVPDLPEVTKEPMKQESIFGHSKHLRQMAEDQHCYLKNVKITGFSSAKSLVELVCYILKNSVSLECLTLDTLCDQRSGCCYMGNDVQKVLKEARRALGAITTYIEDKVPARVKLTVLEPCSLCHKL